jgi:hypothetical protein
MRRHDWLIPLAALAAIAPLALGGPSCGKDIAFHMQSWYDAAAQLRHGTLYPRWTFTAAYNAGEPRFTFYPPIGWLLGGLLTVLLPFAAVPIVLAWLALTLAGFAMHRLASGYASPTAALLAACLYLANPPTHPSITARPASCEIFTAAFCPLLFAAMLAQEPTVWPIAFPLAGMALSNVPGGILGGYLFLFLALIRLITVPSLQRKHALLTFTLAPIAALGLAAIYLLPAIHERPFIHMADAFTPGLRPTDNLLLHRTLLLGRDDFLMQIQDLAAAMAAVTLIALTIAWRMRPRDAANTTRATLTTTAVAIAVLFGMIYLAAPFWRALPTLWIVQFPWRALFILATCASFAAALAMRKLQLSPIALTLAAFALTAALAASAIHQFRETCAASDRPSAFLAMLQQHRTPEPTDEYIPAQTRLGAYRPDNPPFWLSTNPAAYAPNTTPNLIDTEPDAPLPNAPPNAHLEATPLHFTVTTTAPTTLIVNLEDYPNWRVTLNATRPPHIPRPDGLIAFTIPPGTSTVSITWQHGWDERLGILISLLTLIAWLIDRKRSQLTKSLSSRP